MPQLLKPILCLLILFSFYESSAKIFLSNKKRRSELHYTSYYLSTDLLSTLNAVIEKRNFPINFSLEVCRDHKFGIQLTTNLEREQSQNYRTSDFLIRGELRRYLIDDVCSALHYGVYFSHRETSTAIKSNNSYFFQRGNEKSLLEAGITGGYKALFGDRWVINPLAYVGMSYMYHLNVYEKSTIYSLDSTTDMVVQVALQVGYRF